MPEKKDVLSFNAKRKFPNFSRCYSDETYNFLGDTQGWFGENKGAKKYLIPNVKCAGEFMMFFHISVS